MTSAERHAIVAAERRVHRPDSPVVPVPVSAAFDFGWVVRFLSARVVPSIERVDGTGYRRTVRVSGAAVTLDVRPHAPRPGATALRVRSTPALPERVLVALVRRMFDLDAAVDDFVALTRRDRVLGPLVARRPHVRLPQLLDPFEGLARAILGQQVSVAAASTMADRVARLAGEPAPAPEGECSLCFPSAEALAAVPEMALTSIGLTRAKAASLSAAACAVAEGRLELDALRGGDADQVDAALTAVRGVGPWTAAYVRMRALGDRDAFPATDLGVIKAMRSLAGVESAADITRRAEWWRPWRAYAALHLWESLAPDPAPGERRGRSGGGVPRQKHTTR